MMDYRALGGRPFGVACSPPEADTAWPHKTLPALLSVTLLLWASLAVAEEPSISAKVDKTVLAPEDFVTLTVTVSSEGYSISGDPEFPPFDEFDITNTYQSSNFSSINGRASLVRIFSLVLRPKKAGTLRIPAIKFHWKGKELTTQPISVNVGGGGSTPSPTTASEEPQTAVGVMHERLPSDPYVEAVLSKDSCVTNEPIVYTFRVFSKRAQWSEVQLVPPSFKGFLMEEPPDSKSSRYVAIGDQPYHLEEVRTLIIPVAPGHYTIEPTKFAYLTDYFFGDRRIMKTQPLEVTVHQLPDQGKPPGFSGSVGSFSATASVEKNEAAVDEPLTLTVVVSGEGNLKPLTLLDSPEIGDVRMYPSKASEARISSLQTRKTFEYLLIPQSTGQFTVGPFCFSFFNPQKGYDKACTQSLSFSASAPHGEKLVRKEPSPGRSPDVRPLKLTMKPGNHPALSGRLFIILLLCPWVLIVSVPVVRGINGLLAGDGEANRRRKAIREFRKGIKALSQRGSSPKDVFSEVHRLLSRYVEGLLGIKIGGMTREELLNVLSKAGAGESTLISLRHLLERFDALRYSSPGTAGLEEKDKREILSVFSGLISELDRQP